jgi:hypothetical protein
MWACIDGAMVRAGAQTTRRVGQAIVPGTGAGGDGARTADLGGLRPAREAEGLPVSSTAAVTPVSDGNRDGNDGSRQRA